MRNNIDPKYKNNRIYTNSNITQRKKLKKNRKARKEEHP